MSGELLQGVVLGWSVACTPGPVNAELLRRTVTHGFRAGLALCVGVVLGDGCWAWLVGLGAGAALRSPRLHHVLSGVSLVVLVVMAVRAFRAAALAWQGRATPRPAPEGDRSGPWLGFGLAMTSPWNVAFWLAVMGGELPGDAARLAVGVLLGAAAWGTAFAATLSLARRRVDPARWGVASSAVTALVLFALAVRALLTLVS